MVRGSNSGGGEIFRTCPDRLWGPPSLLYNGYQVFLGVKSGRGVTLTPQPLLVPWSWKDRAIPLLPLWVLRPVQSLSACKRVTFTFTFTFLYIRNRSFSVFPLSSSKRLRHYSKFEAAIVCFSCSYPDWNSRKEIFATEVTKLGLQNVHFTFTPESKILRSAFENHSFLIL